MKKFFSVGFATIASLLLIFAIVFTSMELTMNDQTFIENEFTKLQISNSMGIHNTDLVKSTMRLINYMQGKVPDIDVDVTLNGETVPMFALEQEHTHMEDVQKIFLQIKDYRDYGVLVMLVLFLFAAVINFKKAPQTLAQGYLSGAFIALLFIGFLGTWAISDFTSFWTFFHEALFWNDLWLFDASASRMINMLPEQMFSDIVGRIFLYAGIAIAALIAVSILALIFTSKAYKRKRAESIKKQRARKIAVEAAAKARAEARANAKAAREQQKAEKEKAKRIAEKQKRKGKAKSGSGKPKKKKSPEESSVQSLQAQAAADTDALTYAEDAEGYPIGSGDGLDSISAEPNMPSAYGDLAAAIPMEDAATGEELASIDDILRMRKKARRAPALPAPAEIAEPAEEKPALEAPAEKPQATVEYAFLTSDGRIAAVDEFVETEEPVPDAPPTRDSGRIRRDSGRVQRTERDSERMEKPAKAQKKSTLSGIQKTLQKAAKSGAQASAKAATKPKKRKQRDSIQDDTGFFDE